eukprot:s1_g1008.t1
MSAVELVRVFLALFFVSAALFYVARIVLLNKQLSGPAVYIGQPGSLHFITHRLFVAFRAAILGVCVLRVPFPAVDAYLGHIGFLNHEAVILFGAALLAVSAFGIIKINLFLKNNWRSGTRPDDTSELVTTGPFAISQNPMMLFVVLAQVGFFLALPTAFSLVCLLVGVWAVITQVGIEREGLTLRFGEEYLRYAEATPRWLFYRTKIGGGVAEPSL